MTRQSDSEDDEHDPPPPKGPRRCECSCECRYALLHEPSMKLGKCPSCRLGVHFGAPPYPGGIDG